MSSSGRVLVACVVLSGCGGAGVANGSSDLSAFQQEITAAAQALDSYQGATGTMMSATDCSAAVNGYADPMRGDLDRMMDGSGGMDDDMRSMSQASHADVTCGVQGMHDELGHHLQVACHEADMVHNREEAARHIAAMANGLHHMQMRAAEISAGMGQMGPGMVDGGWRMWDGGMMSPDDHPMGCSGGPVMDGGMPGGGPGPMVDGGPGPMMDGGMGHMP
jgi:hypothetical protein